MPTTNFAHNEAALLATLQQPDTRHEAFAQLVSSYQRMLYAHIRRMVGDHDDADDTLQNTFIKAWRHIAQFRGDSSLKSWLYRIATNEAITCINKRNKRATSDLADIENTSHAPRTQHQHTTDADAIEQQLQAAIATLPDKQRAVFLLRYYDEMPYTEMSRILETSEGALKASYHHAAKKIEAHLTAINHV